MVPNTSRLQVEPGDPVGENSPFLISDTGLYGGLLRRFGRKSDR